MTEFLAVDAGRFPLVVLTQTGVMDDAEFERFLATISEHLSRRASFAYAYHFAHTQRPPKGRVARQAEFVHANREALAQHCLGIGFVFASPIFRFAISSFLLLQPLPMPYEVCRDLKQAVAWAERRLRSAGVAVPLAAPGVR